MIWYKEGQSTPIYSFDVRHTEQLDKGSHHDAGSGSLNGRSHFNTTIISPSFVISNVKSQDNGLYRCRVDFVKSPTRNIKIQLNVIGELWWWDGKSLLTSLSCWSYFLFFTLTCSSTWESRHPQRKWSSRAPLHSWSLQRRIFSQHLLCLYWRWVNPLSSSHTVNGEKVKVKNFHRSYFKSLERLAVLNISRFSWRNKKVVQEATLLSLECGAKRRKVESSQIFSVFADYFSSRLNVKNLIHFYDLV